MKKEAAENLSKCFEGANVEMALSVVLESLSPLEEFFFLRSIINQRVVGYKRRIPSNAKIHTDTESLSELLVFYANRHKKIITGTFFPTYGVANTILINRKTDDKYLQKLCNRSKKEYPSSDYYWSDFCFPKKNIPDEIMTSNAMAWSTFSNGLSIKKGWAYSFAAGLRTSNEAVRTSWRSTLRYPDIDPVMAADRWINNVNDHEREVQIVESKRGTYRNTKPNRRSKYLTEFQVNKEWYIRHFDVEKIKPKLKGTAQPFLIPSTLAPFGWISVLIRFYLSGMTYSESLQVYQLQKALNEQAINPSQRRYAEKIPYYGIEGQLLKRLIKDNHLIFNLFSPTNIWKS